MYVYKSCSSKSVESVGKLIFVYICYQFFFFVWGQVETTGVDEWGILCFKCG